MKNIILLAVSLALIASAFGAQPFISNYLDNIAHKSHKEIFKAYYSLHRREYDINSEEGINRYRIFKSNLAWIKQENEKLGKDVYGITKFTDMTHEEFVKKQLLHPDVFEEGMKKLKEKSVRFLADKEVHYHHHVHYYHNEEAPKNFGRDNNDDDNHNWRKEKRNEDDDDNHNWTVGDIDHRKFDNVMKDQGSCGSCWAFAAIGAIENSYHQLTGNLTTFSEQYLVDCDQDDNGCNGGYPTRTFGWIKNNGIIEDRFLPYYGNQEACNPDLAEVEYKIVDGAEYFDYMRQNQTDWDRLLAKGPLVVGMDAGFSAFSLYRPLSNFYPLRPKALDCLRANHAVVIVGKITEDGEEFLIGRNSWGTDWGYKGYFKITRSINCRITDLGWLPKVYNGKVPDKKTIPHPEPSTDCVKLYGEENFRKPLMETCDSVNGMNSMDYPYFAGIRFNSNNTTPLEVLAFPWDNCAGDWQLPINESQGLITRNGRKAYPASLAYVKNVKPGCVNLYTDSCHKGDAKYVVCEDVNDFRLVNFSQFSKVRSILPDTLGVERISFFTEANFRGRSYVMDAKPDYNTDWNFDFRLIQWRVKSIKIHRK